MLEIECTKCDRYGRRHVDRLIAEYGADCALPDLKAMLASDCPIIRPMRGAFIKGPGRR